MIDIVINIIVGLLILGIHVLVLVAVFIVLHSIFIGTTRK
jgi:hypothetical protein